MKIVYNLNCLQAKQNDLNNKKRETKMKSKVLLAAGLMLTAIVFFACSDTESVTGTNNGTTLSKGVTEQERGVGIYVKNCTGQKEYFYLKENTSWKWYEVEIDSNATKRYVIPGAGLLANATYKIYGNCGAANISFTNLGQWDSHFIDYKGYSEYFNYTTGGATNIVENDNATGPCLP